MSAVKRLEDVDRAKGLAIALVAAGHLIADEFPKGNEWYHDLNLVLYKFHMPFFMFLTGMVALYSYRAPRSLDEYGTYVWRRFLRLIPAYCLFALLMAAAKVTAAWFVRVENPVNHLTDLAYVFVRPRYSYCGYLWYIYVVFVYTLVLPGLMVLARQRIERLLVPTLIIYFLPATTWFAVEQVFEYAFVFVLGGCAAVRFEQYTRAIDRYHRSFLGVFLICLGLAFHFPVPKLLLGLLSIPALHSLVRTGVLRNASVLAMVGNYVFPIYLMNAVVIGVFRVTAQKLGVWDGGWFILLAPIMLAAGVFGPILIQRLFVSRIPVLKEIIR